MAEVYSYTFVRDVHYFSVKAEGRVFQNALLLRQAFPARAQVFREKSPPKRGFFSSSFFPKSDACDGCDGRLSSEWMELRPCLPSEGSSWVRIHS